VNDDREAFEFAYALYLARQVDREAAQMIVQAAKEGIIGIDQATEALRLLSRNGRRRFADKNNT
jgi:AICAR transformylase/IMP cyclohydrolase PurH